MPCLSIGILHDRIMYNVYTTCHVSVLVHSVIEPCTMSVLHAMSQYWYTPLLYHVQCLYYMPCLSICTLHDRILCNACTTCHVLIFFTLHDHILYNACATCHVSVLVHSMIVSCTLPMQHAMSQYWYTPWSYHVQCLCYMPCLSIGTLHDRIMYNVYTTCHVSVLVHSMIVSCTMPVLHAMSQYWYTP